MLVHFLLDSRRPHKKGRRPLRRRRAPRSQSRKTPRSATLPKPRRRVVVEPLLPCAKTYIRATARSSRRKASRQDYFTGTEVVAWSRQPRNHACGNARRWEKLYHQTLTNAFLKNSSVIVNALIFVLEVPVSVVPSFRVSDWQDIM